MSSTPTDLTDSVFKNITAPDFIGVERNLELLGFFSPSYNQRRKIPKKTISGTVTKNGQKIRVQVSILPSAEYGLPITNDLDIYRAFQKILKDIYLENGEITNPITFKDEQLIKAMGKGRYGRLTNQIRHWLHRMKFTGILSEGYVYDKGKKEFIQDSVNVFDRTVAYGRELNSGQLASQNYVWLSDWYLSNINNQYAFLIDNEVHKRLKTAIAKSLYPILWFRFYGIRKQSGDYYHKRYASKTARVGEKDSLCDILGITEQKSLSLIKRQLDPAHRELRKQGVISKWEYERTVDNQTYNIKWWAGAAFDQYYSGNKTYARKLANQSAILPAKQESSQSQQALNLVLYFQKAQNHLDTYSPTTKELQQAADLIERLGDEVAAKVVDFAISEMERTNFDAKHFGAVLQYTEQAIEIIKRREQEDQRQAERRAAEQQERDEQYQWWIQATPEQQVQSKLEFRITGFRMSHKREPTEQEIEQLKQELINHEPTIQEKQQNLFGYIKYPADCQDRGEVSKQVI